MYGKIGETIEDHYREAFGHSSGKHHFRMLKARGKKGPPSTPSSRLSWQEDWKRGLKIAHCFENLSNVIIDHYFDLLFDESPHSAIKTDQEQLMAGLYAVQGHNVAQSYLGKSKEILRFYSGDSYNDLRKMASIKRSSSDDSLLLGKAIEDYYATTYGTRKGAKGH